MFFAVGAHVRLNHEGVAVHTELPLSFELDPLAPDVSGVVIGSIDDEFSAKGWVHVQSEHASRGVAAYDPAHLSIISASGRVSRVSAARRPSQAGNTWAVFS